MAIKTYKRGSADKLSANFKASEFLCHGNGCCAQGKVDEKLVEILQKIRDRFGKPVTVNSGYRCAKHNKAVGGASGSYHTKGMAADIVVRDVAPAEVAKYAESIGVLGIGLYETNTDGHFVHIDTRTTKFFWYGQKQELRTTFGGKPVVTEETSGYTLKQFIKDVQAACGASVDGIAGPETIRKTPTVSSKKNYTHSVVVPLQKRLDELGYKMVGEADGIAGKKFTMAVSEFQADNGCWIDGEITAKNKTWRKLLEME